MPQTHSVRRADLYLRRCKPLDVCSYVLPDKVTYKGLATVVHEGQPWWIECKDLKPDDLIRWTRNGQSLEPELASGQLVVHSPIGTGSSTLTAIHATDSHDGDYKCTPDSNEAFHLWIYVGSYAELLNGPVLNQLLLKHVLFMFDTF